MVSVLVVTLGKTAESLIEASERIIDRSGPVASFCVDWGDPLETARDKLGERIKDMDKGDGLLLLTDIYGGTSTNIAMDFREPEKVEVVTGVNLPMIVKAMTLPAGLSPGDAARQLRDQARKGLGIAAEIK